MNISAEILRYFLYPPVGALVGFTTNFLAIKLLFRPTKRFLGIQGLLPKRKNEIAKRAGEIVNNYLVNSEDIRRQIDRERLGQAVERFLERNKNTLWEIPMMKKMAKAIIVALLIDRDGYFNRNVIESIMHNEMVSEIVRSKINEFDISEIEKLVKKASGPELNFIIISGGVLGFFVGLVEALIGI